MKRIGIGVGIVAVLSMAAACSDDATTPGGGSSGSAGTPALGGGGAGGMAGGAGGAAAGSASTAGMAGGGTGGVAGGSGGSGGSSGSAGAAGSGGSGGGAASCETKLGKAIKFAGGNTVDSVAGDLGTDGPLGDDARTVELWAKFTGASSWEQEHTILELGVPSEPDNHNNVFGIDLSGRVDDNNGAFGPYVHGWSDNNGKDVRVMAPANAGWLHLSWAYDPTKEPNKRLEFTVNGEPIAVQFTQSEYDRTAGKLVLNKGYVLLGASQKFGAGGWDGAMDEVRIWKAYRSPQQIKDNMKVIVKPDAPGLVAYYQFDEADAANVADSTKKASHKLVACAAVAGACGNANTAMPTFVDSDITGPFTCGQ